MWAGEDDEEPVRPGEPRSNRAKVTWVLIAAAVFVGTVVLCCMLTGQVVRLMQLDPPRMF